MSKAAAQRAELVDTLTQLSDEQWAAETMCAGWDTGDLAAHLLVREREPLAAPGIFIGGPLARVADNRMRARKAQGRHKLTAQLAAGPPRLLRLGPLDDVQAVEDWIHHEDVRRGGAKLGSRATSPGMADPLWAATGRFARLTLARTASPGVVAYTDGSRALSYKVGPEVRWARTTDAAPDVTVSGQAGELALFVTGRNADVQMSGDPQLINALRQNSSGV